MYRYMCIWGCSASDSIAHWKELRVNTNNNTLENVRNYVQVPVSDCTVNIADTVNRIMWYIGK